MKHRALPILRIAVVWLVTTVTLLVLGAIPSDVQVKDFGAALVAGALIGPVNAFIGPLLIRIALPLTVLTLGLGVVVLNGAMVLLVSAIEPGLDVSTLRAGIAVALGLTIASTAAISLLAIDDDAFWYRNVIRRRARRPDKPATTDVPGLFFLEIDGLAHDVLGRAMRDGNAPTMSRWLREGSHRLPPGRPAADRGRLRFGRTAACAVPHAMSPHPGDVTRQGRWECESVTHVARTNAPWTARASLMSPC